MAELSTPPTNGDLGSRNAVLKVRYAIAFASFASMPIARSICALAAALALATAAPSQTTLQTTSKLGTPFYSLADEKGVVPAAQKNLAADPKNPDLLLKLAQAQISVWQDKEAVETLTRALAISPQNADLLTERGHRELPLREFAQARADLTPRRGSQSQEHGGILSPRSGALFPGRVHRGPPMPFATQWKPRPTRMSASTPLTGCMPRCAARGAPPRRPRPWKPFLRK
jgi:hypothetical protein